MNTLIFVWTHLRTNIFPIWVCVCVDAVSSTLEWGQHGIHSCLWCYTVYLPALYVYLGTPINCCPTTHLSLLPHSLSPLTHSLSVLWLWLSLSLCFSFYFLHVYCPTSSLSASTCSMGFPGLVGTFSFLFQWESHKTPLALSISSYP